ncbi:hypothetical protein NBRC116594_34310 [Shimia sp. NS0008-38b]|uniref:hypothetical protein n=1 Tax=Shimia sp. NS0008-38b TaxID=3127653 RepID=UPI00310B8B41
MNANQIVNMITRVIIRRLVNGGINAGIKAASRKQSSPERDHNASQRPKAQQNSGSGVKQAKQAMRILRKTNRF